LLNATATSLPLSITSIKGRRENLLWPVYAWKVLYPDERQRTGINLFQETLLGLIRAGIRDTDELAEAMALDPGLSASLLYNFSPMGGWTADSGSRPMASGSSTKRKTDG
jgi:hypothetical protein